MAFGRDLKEALGQLARLSAGYTPEVIQKKQALARLGEVDLRGKLLENDAKLERMKQLRTQAEQAAQQARGAKFESAVRLQSQLPSSEDPSFVGPRLEDNGMMNPGGEGLLPGYDTASEVYGVEEGMRPQVRAVGGGIRERAMTQERRAAEKFAADQSYRESQEQFTDARTQRELAAAEKLARESGGGSGMGGGGSELDDAAANLMNGMPADKISIKIRNAAMAEARRRGGFDGTGFVAASQKQQDNFDLYRDIYSKAERLQQLLRDREVQARLGPYMGRITDWTMELPGGAPTQVKEAWNLFKDLSDTELRKRSGAAISPGEYLRIIGFTIDPTKQLDSNSTNLARMLEKIENSLRLQGVRNFDSLRSGGGISADRGEAPTSSGKPRYNPATGKLERP